MAHAQSWSCQVRRFSLALGCALVLALPAASAQEIRGRLLMPDSTSGASGVVLTAMNAANVTVARSLSGTAGAFLLRLPSAGRYEIRAVRIGYVPTVVFSGSIGEGQSLLLDPVLNWQPIVLTTMDARATNECGLRAAEGAQLVQLWEQARAALSATHLSSNAAPLWGHVVRIDGSVDPNGRRLVMDSTSLRELALDLLRFPRFDSSGTARLVRSADEGGFEYDVPSVELLVSDPFIASHCFGIATPPKTHPSWIGVTFRPQQTREDQVDIRGVLWLERASAELRRLEYQYVNIPIQKIEVCDSTARVGGRIMCGMVSSGDDASGTVDYQRLVSGEWIAQQWTVRTSSESPRGSSNRCPTVIEGPAGLPLY
jgi:hypothetical protein